MMSLSARSHVLSSARWTLDNDHFLGQFVDTFPLPCVAIVTKGQHLDVGVPNVANPTLKPYVLVHSKRKIRKVLARSVCFKDENSLSSFAAKFHSLSLTGKRKFTEHLTIPETFTGFFELMSEDGQPVQCLHSSIDLDRHLPELCLVRRRCKAYLPDQGGGELHGTNRSRTVDQGEVLTPVGRFCLKRTAFLRCFDEQGDSIYLKLDDKLRFSPVMFASIDGLSGVHTMAGLLEKRLPLTVKLVEGGKSPSEEKPTFGFTSPILQLLSVTADELAVVLSLSKTDERLQAVPLKAHLRLAPAVNNAQLRNLTEFRSLVDECDRFCAQLFNRPTVHLDGFSHLYHCWKNVEPNQSIRRNVPTSSVSDEEIEQLYDYIRGLGPLADDDHQCTVEIATSDFDKMTPADANYDVYSKPSPPPIETIPTRKVHTNCETVERASPMSRRPTSRHSSLVPQCHPSPSTPPMRRPTNKSRPKCRPFSMADSNDAPMHQFHPAGLFLPSPPLPSPSRILAPMMPPINQLFISPEPNAHWNALLVGHPAMPLVGYYHPALFQQKLN